MHIRQRIFLAALFLGALVVTGCGAKQGRHVELNANWSDLYEAVPADVMAAYGYTLNNEGEFPGLFQDVFEDERVRSNMWTVFSVLAQESLVNSSELSEFIRPGAEWFVIEVSDLPHAMESLGAYYQELAASADADIRLDADRIGKRVVLRLEDTTRSDRGKYTTITGVGNYVIMRASASSDVARADKDIRALCEGWPEVGRYAETEDGAAQRARTGGQGLRFWGVSNTGALNAEEDKKTPSGESSGLADTTSPEEVDLSEACSTLNARVEALIPSIHAIAFTNVDNKKQTELFVRLSDEGIANGRNVMRGAPSLAPFGRDALLGMAISFDFGSFLESMKALPAHAECDGLAGIVGEVSKMVSAYADHIKFNARTVTGTGVVLLDYLNLKAGVPTTNLGVFIESPNAEALFQRIVRALSMYGSAQVLTEAEAPVVEVSLSLMPIGFRIEQGDDRVIVTTGGMNEELGAHLMTVEPHSHADIPFELEVNGERLREVMQWTAKVIEAMQVEDAIFDQVLQVLKRDVHGVHVQARFEEKGLRLTIKQRD